MTSAAGRSKNRRNLPPPVDLWYLVPVNLSIVIPAYNEEARLGASLEAIRGELPDAEILVVDDGSRDGTVESARRRGVHVVSYADNRGKGFALRTGMLAAGGDRILFTDADLSTPIHEVGKLQARLDAGFHIAVGSRKMRGARLLRRQPILRETLGKGFTFLSQLALGVRVMDFTCGFKLFTRSCARDLFSRMTIDRWGFDTEVLFLAACRRYRVAEVPVTWSDDRHTKVALGRDVARSLLDLAKIRWNDLLGRYHGTP